MVCFQRSIQFISNSISAPPTNVFHLFNLFSHKYISIGEQFFSLIHISSRLKSVGKEAARTTLICPPPWLGGWAWFFGGMGMIFFDPVSKLSSAPPQRAFCATLSTHIGIPLWFITHWVWCFKPTRIQINDNGHRTWLSPNTIGAVAPCPYNWWWAVLFTSWKYIFLKTWKRNWKNVDNIGSGWNIVCNERSMTQLFLGNILMPSLSKMSLIFIHFVKEG